MVISHMVYFLLIMLTGGILQSVTGFGLSVYAVCLLPLFIPMQESVVIISIMTLLVCVQILIKFYRKVQWKVMLPTIIATLSTQNVGFLILMTVDEGILKKILGVLLIILALYNMIFAEKMKIRPTIKNGIIAGMVSGVLTGMFNIGGPPLVMYYLSVFDDKDRYTATLQASFVISIFLSLIMHASQGNITTSVLGYVGLGIVAILPGVWIGMKIFNYLDKKVLTRIIYLFLAVMGVLQLVL